MKLIEQKLTFIFVAVSLIMGIVAGFFLAKIIFKQKIFNYKKSNSAIVAPYYETKVFRQPVGLEKISTGSGQMKNQLKRVKIPIIMFHYVEYIKDINDLVRKRLDISPSLFEEYLKALKKSDYQTFFVSDIPNILSDQISYSSRSAVLTFDDGYEDFYTVVFPLLKKYQMKATIYIIYDYIGRSGFLNDDEIKELIKSQLVEIGSHTLDHLYLKLVPERIAYKQIFESKQLLEKRFSIKVNTFAYPYGAFNKKTIDLIKEAGYTTAVSVIPGTYQSEENIFYLSRLRPGLFTPKTMIKFFENYNK